jgi:hypothetical protein
MIGNMIAEITRGIGADDMSSRLAGAGGRDRACCVLSSRRRGVRASAVMGGAAGLGPQPLGDLEGDADLEAVAGQRERE